MKNWITLSTVVLLGSGALLATGVQADEGEKKDPLMYKITGKEFDVEMVKTPVYNAATEGPRSHNVERREWMQIEVEIDAKYRQDGDYISRLKAEFFMGVQMSAGKARKLPKDKRFQYSALAGEITFKEVRPTKGNRVYLVAYISPDMLYKTTGKERVSKRDIEKATVRITAEKMEPVYLHMHKVKKGEEKKEWWKHEKIKLFPDTVLAKKATPYHLISNDTYPQTLGKDEE